MPDTTHHQQKQQQAAAGEALSDIASNGARDSEWVIYHDPSTGQMRYVRQDDPTYRPAPGSVPVNTFAENGFAALDAYTCPTASAACV